MLNNNDPIYNFINTNYYQQLQNRYHNEQMYNIADATKKFDDFLEAYKKVSPEYKETLLCECFIMLCNKISYVN